MPAVPAMDAEFAALPHRSLASAARSRALDLGASHCDVRVEQIRIQNLLLVDGALIDAAVDVDVGMAVRVVLDGTWGFAAGVSLTVDEAVRLSELAIAVAQTAKAITLERIELAEEPSYPDATWVSSYDVDPFEVPTSEKVALLRDWSERLLAHKVVQHVSASVLQVRENKFYADSHGTATLQQRVRLHPEIEGYGVDSDRGILDSMRSLPRWSVADGSTSPVAGTTGRSSWRSCRGIWRPSWRPSSRPLAAALAADAQPSPALGGGQVVEVEADGLADPGAGEAQHGARARSRGAAARMARCNRMSPRPTNAFGARRAGKVAVEFAESAAQREVRHRGERGVDGGWGALQDAVQVGFVVAGGPRRSGRVVERVAVDVAFGEPGEVDAHPGQVGAPGLGGHVGAGEVRGVDVQDRRVRRRQHRRGPAAPGTDHVL